jgi:signal transduction histidine kinase
MSVSSSERIRRDSSGAEAEIRLRAIIEKLADGIVIVDRRGIMRFANPAAEALFGRPQSELVGQLFGHLALAGETMELDILRRGGGGTVTAELRAVDVEWEGESARLLSLRDITHRRLVEEQARRLSQEQAARAEAEAASHAKSEFLAMMSHELRTPLNAVLGYVQLMELGLAGPLTDQQRLQLGRIRASGSHLLGLVNEVLDLAKVEAGRLNVQRAVVSASEVAGAAVALILPQAGERGLTLAEVRQSAPPLFMGDEDRVRQVLLNLLSNAVKFTAPGGRITLEYGLTAQPDDDAQLPRGHEWVAFRVTDTGIGVEADKLTTIFDPFVQAETGHTRPRDGSGLGLTISRRLARLMGGDLTVTSRLGKGSTFTLWLAAAPPNAEESSLPKSTPTTVPATIASAGLASMGERLLRETEPLLKAVVGRLRTDPAIPNVQQLKYTQIADHFGTLFADIAESLVVLEESADQPSPIMADATLIQRLIAERHGIQRARLGWPPSAIQREYEIVREEVERILNRALSESRPPIPDALGVVMRFFEQAEYVSLTAHAKIGET